MIRLKAHKSATIRTLASAGLIAIGLVVSTAIPARADGGSGTFSATRSMNTARMGHTATLLTTGQVLVAGGETQGAPTPPFPGPGNSAPIASAELYNPALGKWTVTGSMATPRLGLTATLLPNGQVLVAGGTPDFYSCLATAELFNPATGKWTTTGSMTAARCFHEVHLPVAGLYNSALASGSFVPEAPHPPVTSTSPFGSSVAVWFQRAVFRLPVSAHVPEVPAKAVNPTANNAANTKTRIAANLFIFLQIMFL